MAQVLCVGENIIERGLYGLCDISNQSTVNKLKLELAAQALGCNAILNSLSHYVHC